MHACTLLARPVLQANPCIICPHCCCRLLACLLLQQWVPTLAGLSLIPLFPVLDEPAEDLIESVFDRVWPLPKVDGFVRKQVRHVVARLRKQLEGWAEHLEQLE